MKAESWNPDWLQTHCTELSMVGAWRGVETQYIAASMKLVDTMEEYDLAGADAGRKQTSGSTFGHTQTLPVVESVPLLSTAQFTFSPRASKRSMVRVINVAGRLFWKLLTGACASFWIAQG